MSFDRKLMAAAVNACREKKGENIVALDISGLTVIADAFLIVSASNERQVSALHDAIEEALFKAGYPLRRAEGKQSNEWVLLDYGDTVIHVFKSESRAFYNLERIWRDAVLIDLDSIG